MKEKIATLVIGITLIFFAARFLATPFDSVLRDAAQTYEEATGQPLTDINQLKEPFNDKEGNYHKSLLLPFSFLNGYSVDSIKKILIDNPSNKCFHQTPIDYKTHEFKFLKRLEKLNIPTDTLLPLDSKNEKYVYIDTTKVTSKQFNLVVRNLPPNYHITFPVQNLTTNGTYNALINFRDDENNTEIIEIKSWIENYKTTKSIIKKVATITTPEIRINIEDIHSSWPVIQIEWRIPANINIGNNLPKSQ